jgi:hypothetical protein
MKELGWDKSKSKRIEIREGKIDREENTNGICKHNWLFIVSNIYLAKI